MTLHRDRRRWLQKRQVFRLLKRPTLYQSGLAPFALRLAQTSASVAQVWNEPWGHGHFELIDVAPGPPLAWLEGDYDRMARAVEVLRRVPVGRAITTTDVTAGYAETQVDPR